MITELHIDGFRGLDNVNLEPLGRVNMLVGPGNSGKTNLLESVFLFCSNGDPGLIRRVLGLRNIGDATPSDLADHVEWFWTVQREAPITFRGRWKGAERTVSIRRLEGAQVIPLTGDPNDPTPDDETSDLMDSIAAYEVQTIAGKKEHKGHLFIKPKQAKISPAKGSNLICRFLSIREMGQSRRLAFAWTKVKDAGDDSAVVSMLRSLDPDIEGVELRADEAERASVRIQHKRLGGIPLEYMGAGFGKAFAIACNLATSRDGILIIDEFDASLDVAAQPKIIRFALENALKHNVQLFVSTHSLETLDAFLECYLSAQDLLAGPEDFRILKLKRTDGVTEIRSLDAEKAKRLRCETGFDLRLPA